MIPLLVDTLLYCSFVDCCVVLGSTQGDVSVTTSTFLFPTLVCLPCPIFTTAQFGWELKNTGYFLLSVLVAAVQWKMDDSSFSPFQSMATSLCLDSSLTLK